MRYDGQTAADRIPGSPPGAGASLRAPVGRRGRTSLPPSFQRPAPLRERRGCHASGSFCHLTLITAPTVALRDRTRSGWRPRVRSYSGVDLADFEESLQGSAPPAGVSGTLEALWHERRGNWDRAHEIAQDIAGTDGSWVHAYLHRREGDLSNAAYWYRQARKPVARGNLDDEWRGIVEALLTVL
jgi:hypothetical protein